MYKLEGGWLWMRGGGRGDRKQGEKKWGESGQDKMIDWRKEASKWKEEIEGRKGGRGVSIGPELL